MLLNPSKFRDEVISNWNTRVAGHVVDNEKQPLTGGLAAYVEQYDFSAFGYATIDEILDAHRPQGVLGRTVRRSAAAAGAGQRARDRDAAQNRHMRGGVETEPRLSH
jgi:hypothetical protein